LFTGLFGRPQMFWPIRRSILYFDSLRFVIRVLVQDIDRFEETRPPAAPGICPAPTGSVPKA
jgi:hypothetical protein